MTVSLIAMTTELVQALIHTGYATPQNLSAVLESTYTTLHKLNDLEQRHLTNENGPNEATSWEKSIGRHTITCLECGAIFKQLSRKHLSQHGLNVQSYRARFGIPPTQPLVATATQARRRKVANQVKPWEKTRQRSKNPP